MVDSPLPLISASPLIFPKRSSAGDFATYDANNLSAAPQSEFIWHVSRQFRREPTLVGPTRDWERVRLTRIGFVDASPVNELLMRSGGLN